MTVRVTFHGACGIVTGSCYEVRTEQGAVLIDCGMFQGTKSVKELNYGAFAFKPGTIDALLLTHSHVDHCGLLPKLVVAGFKKPIIASRPTADLLTYVLPDSGYIQETEVERLNRRNRRRGRPQVEPIYTRADGEATARRVTSKPMDKWFDVAPGFRARFWDAGHILGAVSVELVVSDPRKGTDMHLLFSGDVGTGDNMFQRPPRAPTGIDYLFAESTYGDRTRTRLSLAERRAALKKEVAAALGAGGILLIPAFAIERTQQLLFDLDHLFDAGELPTVPVFVDSPLAIKATRVFTKYLPLSPEHADVHPFKRPNLRFTQDVEMSKKLERLHGGAIIIAGSGMCDAGRVRHHLKNYLSDSHATVLLVGYQAPGTMGRLLSEGVRMVRIHGEEIAVNARIRMLDEYSGHADQRGMVKWIKQRAPIKNEIFLVHGEEPSRAGLAAALEAAGIPGEKIRRPALGETVQLTGSGSKTERIEARVDVAASGSADWHNAYAETVIALRQSLDAAKDERSRRKILERIKADLPVPASKPSRRSKRM